jgi:hypothetical protein
LGKFILLVVDIVKQTPIWAWGILALLLYRGFRALRGGIVSLPRLALIPLLFSIWGFYDVATADRFQASSFIAWGLCFAIGLAAGKWRVSGIPIRADKLHRVIELPGSKSTLVLMLLIFAVKYTAGVVMAIHEELRSELWFALLNAGVSGFVAGMFTGQLLGYWQKFRAASHTLLMPE